jgi:hypothetical protein
MPRRRGGANRDARQPRDRHPDRKGPRPTNAGRSPKSGRAPGQPVRGRGSIGLARLEDGDFELVHPHKVDELEPDYEESIELWKAGDPESARDALRYTLAACHDNMWVHVALGQIALGEFRDPALARGHFGYAFELGQRALPAGFRGRLARERRRNRPFYDAIEGLIQCFVALGRPQECQGLRALRERLSGASS